VLWGIFILFLTLMPGTMIPRVSDFWSLFRPDKLVHLFLFGIFCWLLLIDFIRRGGTRLKTHPVIWSLLISALLGGFIEIAQYFFIPGRDGSVWDFIADMMGAMLGWAFFHFFFSRKYS
jgi:VanZ family protein